MTCLPCAKEIIDGFAKEAWRQSHRMAKEIPELVKAGRLKPADADKFLSMLTSAEEDLIAAVRDVGTQLANVAAPPWPEPAVEETP